MFLTRASAGEVVIPNNTTKGSQDPLPHRLVKVGLSILLAGWDRLPGRRLADRARGVILLYHDVPPAEQARFGRQLDQLLAAGKPASCDDMVGRADGIWRLAITFDDGLLSFDRVARPELDSRLIGASMFAISRLLRDADEDAFPTHEGRPTMTRAALASLAHTRHQVGSHGLQHLRLSLLEDDDVRTEFRESMRELEEIMGEPVTTFAFPYGDWNRTTVELARECGYERVYSVNPDLVGAARSDPFVFGRIVVSPTDWPIETWLKLRGSYRWVARWSHFKARLGERG